MTTVTNEQVVAYHPLVTFLARRYNGWSGAEADDLFQEGQVAVLAALRKGAMPSQNIVARRMLDWVNKCARHGLGGYASDQEELDELLN